MEEKIDEIKEPDFIKIEDIEFVYNGTMPNTKSREESMLLHCRLWFNQFAERLHEQEGKIIIEFDDTIHVNFSFREINDDLKKAMQGVAANIPRPNNY